MASFEVKLLIDTKEHKVLFAEAGKDFVDFLFNLLALPIGTVTRLLTKKSMIGSLGNLYGSIENLNETYMQPNRNKEVLLKPQAAIGAAEVPLLLAGECSDANINSKAKKIMYMCINNHRYVSHDPQTICPSCGRSMSYEAHLVGGEAATGREGGYVLGVVTYMVMDDLVVTPMSTISGIALLSKCNVKDLGALEEKVVSVGMEEGLKLLKASLQSKTVLSDIFLGKKVSEPEQVHVAYEMSFEL